MCRIYYKTLGGHVHCRVYFGPEGFGAGKCGDLVFQVKEFRQFMGMCRGVRFVDESLVIPIDQEKA